MNTTDVDLTSVAWRKSSRSEGATNCVELGLAWRKSSRSDGANNCVELAPADCCVAVRDSKRPAQAPLAFPRATWAAFARSARSAQANRFDLG